MEIVDRLVRAGDDDVDGPVVWVDWRSDETEIVDGVSALLAEEDRLDTRVAGSDGRLVVVRRGVEHTLPLTSTRHDRYVAISSLAWLLRDRYELRLLVDSLEGDTHALIVLTREQSAYLDETYADWSAQHTAPLELGHDYFHGIEVPYLDHENHNPRFAADAAAVDDENERMQAQLEEAFSTDPEIQQALRGVRRRVGPLRFLYSLRFWVWAIVLAWFAYRIATRN